MAPHKPEETQYREAFWCAVALLALLFAAMKVDENRANRRIALAEMDAKMAKAMLELCIIGGAPNDDNMFMKPGEEEEDTE